MREVHCQVKHDPPDTYGDCIRAALATVLDLPAEQVPHFAHDGADPHTVLQRVRDYVAPAHSVFVTQYAPCDRAELLAHMGQDNPDTTYLLFGMTAEGGGHVVVCQGGKQVHNPAWYGCSLVSSGPGGWLIWVVART